jgi:hypothetical protein
MENEKFFVTVTAPSAETMRRLATYGLDLFAPTARKRRQGHVIEGLLTLAEIGSLARDGYAVSIDATAASRSRASTGTTTLDAWLQAMAD